MDTLLRAIAITVEEEEPGAFVWRLLEREGTEWTSLDTASRSVGSYAKSMAAGLAALQALIDDFDAGPREEVRTRPSTGHRNASAKPFGFGTLK
jgi:hypothetical protein